MDKKFREQKFKCHPSLTPNLKCIILKALYLYFMTSGLILMQLELRALCGEEEEPGDANRRRVWCTLDSNLDCPDERLFPFS